MANSNHLAVLERGRHAWDDWRRNNPSIIPDLSSADLRCRALAGVNFFSANLSRANLAYARLESAKLDGADLSYANLEGANLRYADLEYANAQGASLNQADLTYSKIHHTHFERANLSGARIDTGEAWGTHFEDANLQGAYLNCVKYRDINFARANLRGANLCYPTPQYSSIWGVVWTGAILPDGSIYQESSRNSGGSSSKFETCPICQGSGWAPPKIHANLPPPLAEALSVRCYNCSGLGFV